MTLLFFFPLKKTSVVVPACEICTRHLFKLLNKSNGRPEVWDQAIISDRWCFKNQILKKKKTFQKDRNVFSGGSVCSSLKYYSHFLTVFHVEMSCFPSCWDHLGQSLLSPYELVLVQGSLKSENPPSAACWARVEDCGELLDLLLLPLFFKTCSAYSLLFFTQSCKCVNEKWAVASAVMKFLCGERDEQRTTEEKLIVGACVLEIKLLPLAPTCTVWGGCG